MTWIHIYSLILLHLFYTAHLCCSVWSLLCVSVCVGASGFCRASHSCSHSLHYEVQESKESRLYSNPRTLHQLTNHYVAPYNTMVLSNAVRVLRGKRFRLKITGRAEEKQLRIFWMAEIGGFKQLTGCLLKCGWWRWTNSLCPLRRQVQHSGKRSCFSEPSQPSHTLGRFSFNGPQRDLKLQNLAILSPLSLSLSLRGCSGFLFPPDRRGKKTGYLYTRLFKLQTQMPVNTQNRICPCYKWTLRPTPGSKLTRVVALQAINITEIRIVAVPKMGGRSEWMAYRRLYVRLRTW